MKDILYEWVRNLVFYQIVVSIIINLIPGNVYGKYIRFFLGMLFMILVMQPVFKVFHLTEQMDRSYVQQMIQQEMENLIEIEGVPKTGYEEDE